MIDYDECATICGQSGALDTDLSRSGLPKTKISGDMIVERREQGSQISATYLIVFPRTFIVVFGSGFPYEKGATLSQVVDCMADDENKREEVLDFYANGIQIALSPFDATLVFGLQVPPQPQQGTARQQSVKTTFKPLVQIRVSPQLAAIVSRTLARGLEDYEKQHGKIPLPAELMKQLGLLP